MNATRAIMLGVAIGLGGAALMALPNVLAPAVADEQPAEVLSSTPNQLWPPAFDPDKLVKWDYYVQPGISIEPERESTVRKIGYGVTTMVQVMQTESGIYSTDGLASPNIQYPGIIKERKPAIAPMLWLWSDGHWASASAFSASSFVSMTPFKGGALVTSDEGQCVVRKDSVYC